jgi:hypothetical protein
VNLQPNLHLVFEAMAASLQDPAMYVTRASRHTNHTQFTQFTYATLCCLT